MISNSKIKAHGHFEILSLEKGEVVWRSGLIENKILNGGLNEIIKHHNGDNSNSLEITSLEIGNGTDPVSASDTDLDNAVLTGVLPSKTIPSTTSIIIEFFIVDADLADGTYTELGLRAGPTLYTRALFPTAFVKAGRDTIVRYTLSYSSD